MYLGIDIGTHTARVAYLDEAGNPTPVLAPDGRDLFPAAARQTMRGLIVGDAAGQSLAGNAETTVVGCTRLMGRAGTLSPQLRRRLPYPVREADGEAVCNLLYAEVKAGEVYGQLVAHLVETAGRTLARPIDGVALTVPASAEDRFRVQARAVVERHGIPVKRLVNQPAAALLAASLPKSVRRVAVVHCGGGSIDISLARRVEAGFRVLSTAGDMNLGGDDLAWAVADQLNARFQTQASINVFAADRGRVAALGLRTAAENALRTLSIAPEMTLTLDHGGGFGRDLVTHLRRVDVDSWLAPLLSTLHPLAQRALSASRLSPAQIDAVVLTGDWAWLSALRETIAEAFSKPVASLRTDNAAQLPVFGAALALANGGQSIWDVTPWPLGINCYYGDTELFSPIIAANAAIPTPAIDQRGAHTESYQTRFPDQTEVKLDILQYRGQKNADPQGVERVPPAECEVLGTWHFTGLKPKRGKHAAFTVTFSVDADGILQLFAKETATGHHLQAQVARGIG